MPISDLFKRKLPLVGATRAESDSPSDITLAFERFSRTIHAAVPVASRTEANQIAAEAQANGWSDAFPLVAWRADEKALDILPGPDDDWEQVGGRWHGMSASVARRVQPRTVTELHVEAFTRQSNGWNLSSGNFVVPQTGIWLIRMYGNVEGISSGTPGDRFFAYQVNGITKQHFDIARTADGGADVYPLTKGDVVTFIGWHDNGSDGSPSGGRIMRAEAIMVQIAPLSWQAVV